MTEENNQGEEYKYTFEDIARYRPIMLAPEFVENEDLGSLEETLINFAEGLGVDKKDVDGIVATAKTSQQSLQNFISIYSNKCQKALGSATLKELRGLYSNSFEEFYSEKNLLKVNEIFNSDETYGSFIKKYAKMTEIIQSKTDHFTEEQKKKAQEDVSELNKIMVPLIEFEKIELESLKGPVNENSLKKKLNLMYEEKPQQEYQQY